VGGKDGPSRVDDWMKGGAFSESPEHKYQRRVHCEKKVYYRTKVAPILLHGRQTQRVLAPRSTKNNFQAKSGLRKYRSQNKGETRENKVTNQGGGLFSKGAKTLKERGPLTLVLRHKDGRGREQEVLSARARKGESCAKKNASLSKKYSPSSRQQKETEAICE